MSHVPPYLVYMYGAVHAFFLKNNFVSPLQHMFCNRLECLPKYRVKKHRKKLKTTYISAEILVGIIENIAYRQGRIFFKSMAKSLN